MTNIKIQNIYYMLSYAFKVLKQNNYKRIEAEDFERIEDLFAEILSRGISQQLKQGLYKEYVPVNEDLLTMKGKLNINGTIKNRINNKYQLNCDFDEFSENNLFNQIIKSTVFKLINMNTVNKIRKQQLKKYIVFFDKVQIIDLSTVSWNRLKFHKHNRNYEMILNICYFVYEGIMQSEKEGKHKMFSFYDEHMERLYEKFIYEYYSQEHKELRVSAPHIEWNLTDEVEENIIKFLPTMKTDIVVQDKDKSKTLIIDAKYYSNTLQQYFNKKTFHSNNLYQIYTYVKNYDIDNTGNVSGLLLYAKSDVDIIGDYDYPMGGNTISVRTLDLNNDFRYIREQMDEIIELL